MLPPMKRKGTVVHVHLPPDTFARVKQLAADDKRSQSYISRELIEKSLMDMRAIEDAEETETLKKGSRR